MIAALLSAVLAAAAGSGPVEGEWVTPGGWSHVRIAPCGRELCGRISWLKKPNGPDGKPQTDKSNPDPKLRDRPLVGLPFIYGFKPDGANAWSGGKIYDPDSGKTYGSKLSVNPDGTLKVSGCILFFCQAQTWRRVR